MSVRKDWGLVFEAFSQLLEKWTSLLQLSL